MYFDSGSPYTFIKESVAGRLGYLHELGEPKSFGGLGNGHFLARTIGHFDVRLLEFWCSDHAYVVDDWVLEENCDMLVGHGFMQVFNIRLDPRRRRVILDRISLKSAQRVL